MIRQPARIALTAAALALAMPLAAAQQTFELPPSSPSPTATPTPAPAGPADERGGLAIPPRAAPDPAPTPVIQPLPAPSATRQPPLRLPAPPRTAASPAPGGAPSLTPAAPAGPAGGIDPAAPAPAAPTNGPLALPTRAPLPLPPADDAAGSALATPGLPDWWPFAAGGLAGLVLLGGGVLLWRRRQPKTLRLAAPVAGAASGALGAAAPEEPLRVDLALEIASATRSVMMFTLVWRLNIANRSDRALNDAKAAVQIVCARASAGSGPSAGAAQGLESIARIGPQQTRSLTGTVQLPLSAITPLRQGQTPLFIPLVHVTLEADGLPAMTRSFVIGTPSASGRVHPIPLDQPPGGIAGLVAQAITLPPPAAAAA